MYAAVIPARGGSKRIPRKNVRPFFGKPMLAWSIELAKSAKIFNKVVVSSDDESILAIAKEHGCDICVKRPVEISDDTTPTAPVISHAISMLGELDLSFQKVCCLYPCAPFTTSKDITDALDLMNQKDSEFAYPVASFPHPVQRAMIKSANGKMSFLEPKNELTPSQQFVETFFDVGQFYWGKSSAWIAGRKMHTDGIGITVPFWRFVDIDNLNDWRQAEIYFDYLCKTGQLDR